MKAADFIIKYVGFFKHPFHVLQINLTKLQITTLKQIYKKN